MRRWCGGLFNVVVVGVIWVGGEFVSNNVREIDGWEGFNVVFD